MIKRDQIESLLKINGVAPSSPDDEIRSVLLNARYKKDEVDAAIMVMRENTRTNKTRVDGLHKVFRTGEALAPEEISQLLGIDIDFDQSATVAQHNRNSRVQQIIIWILSIALAISGLAFYMYVNQIGIFHPSVMG